MLHIGMIVYNKIANVPIICMMIDDKETQEFIKRVKKAAIYSFIDTIIVGGIVFFSSMAVVGSGDLLINIKISFVSSVTIAGLSFFTAMKNKIKVDNEG